MSVKRPDAIDLYIGQRIREARLASGLSQTAVAETLGVTFQQLQKYEKGVNRTAPSRLVRIAEALGKPITWFYEGAPQVRSGALVARAEDVMLVVGQSRLGHRLCRAFNELDASQQDAVVSLAEALVPVTARSRKAA